MKILISVWILFCFGFTVRSQEVSMSTAFAEEINNNTKRALVISGGGARGAFAAGLTNKFANELNIEYEAVFGTSTGALIAPFILLNDHTTLEEVYTTSKQKDILDKKVYNEKKDKLRWWPVLTSILCNRKSIAGSKNLKTLIQKHYSTNDHNTIQSSGKEFVVTTVSLETSQLVYRSSNDFNYDEMVDWMWASANQPVFMTPVEKVGEVNTVTINPSDSCDVASTKTELLEQHWVDGGVKENIPLKEAVEFAAKNDVEIIDVIVLGNARTDDYLTKETVARKKFKVTDQLFRTIEVFSHEGAKNDFKSGLYQARERAKTQIYIYYINPEFLNVSSLNFNKNTMLKMWKAGFNYECKIGAATIDEDGNVQFNPENEMEFKSIINAIQ